MEGPKFLRKAFGGDTLDRGEHGFWGVAISAGAISSGLQFFKYFGRTK